MKQLATTSNISKVKGASVKYVVPKWKFALSLALHIQRIFQEKCFSEKFDKLSVELYFINFIARETKDT